MQYESRSKAVHDAVRSFITEFEWMRKDGGQIIGAILVLYYSGRSDLSDEIARIQHQFRKVISSSLHVHLEEDKCLEIIAIEGSVQGIRSLLRFSWRREE